MRRVVLVAAVCSASTTMVCGPASASEYHHAKRSTARVLRVGTYRGMRGQFSTIQAAVDAAKPGDDVLVAPGDYKTTSLSEPAGTGNDFPAGVLITTPRLTLRGMNRNTVIVDGSKSGPSCSTAVGDQNFGPMTSGGSSGVNGVEVWKANNVTVENMTACNFLGGAKSNGNEFWWNGGANSAKIGGWGYYGAYLNGTSFFYDDTQSPAKAEFSAAEYAIFSSNWDGGRWDHTYASNMNDSGYYIGACQNQCNQTVNDAWAEYNALGYSGSNAGGSLVVENSQFDNNEDGFDTNSQNGDDPPPQNGACPNGTISPITHTHSCWVFMHNYVHDNNNPNVPSSGFAAAGPVGTGLSLSGARNDTVMNNTFANNGAWGIVVVPFPTSGAPCTGGVTNFPAIGCLFDEWGNAIIDNTFTNDGFFGNPTNGQFDQVNLLSGEPTNCYSGNTVPGGSLSSDAASLEKQYPVCTGQTVPATLLARVAFLDEVACDSNLAFVAGQPVPCLPGSHYPRITAVHDGLHPLPPASQLPTMPNPCAGVPANPWCPAHHRKPAAKG
jgi:hypothetical protein